MKVSGHCTLCLGVPVKCVCPLGRDRKDPRRGRGVWTKRRDYGKLFDATVLDVEFQMCFVCCICGGHYFGLFHTCTYNFLCTKCMLYTENAFLAYAVYSMYWCRMPGSKATGAWR
jgi:hypothetical protein